MYIYNLFTCNEWKEPSSFGKVITTCSEEKLINAIEDMILDGGGSYSDEFSEQRNLKEFKDNLLNYGLKEAVNRINYLYLEVDEEEKNPNEMSKTCFLKTLLLPLAQAINPDVTSLDFGYGTNGDEYVYITFKKGHRNVNVTADSFYSITNDVLRKVV
jgi:hypothetical protein